MTIADLPDAELERWLDEGVTRLIWERKLTEAPPALTR